MPVDDGESVAVRDADRVIIFDTTLRDGEQSPGASMNLGQKLQVARALAELGVDVIEAGFAAASPGDLEAIHAVARARSRGRSSRASRAAPRATSTRAWEALKDAPRRRCHVFLATSPIHRDFKLKMAKDEIIQRAVEGVKFARERFDDVEFSAEDSARTELEFLAEVVERGDRGGRRRPSTSPTRSATRCRPRTPTTIRYLKKHVRGIDGVVVSVHCHNDLGLAVANSLAGVMAGARQVECTINGIGERAGNASLEEIVMASARAQDVLTVRTGIKHRAALPDEPARLAGHRPARAAQQGDRRAERVRARGRHPPARHAHPPRDLRDHAAGGRRLREEPARARQALRPPRAARSGSSRSATSSTTRQIDRVFARLQGPGRQEEGHLRRRHRGARRPRPDPRRGRPAWELDALSTTSGTGHAAGRLDRAPRARTASSTATPPPATARSTPSTAPSRRSPASR